MTVNNGNFCSFTKTLILSYKVVLRIAVFFFLFSVFFAELATFGMASPFFT